MSPLFFQFQLLRNGLGGIVIQEIALEKPYIKVYDKTPDGKSVKRDDLTVLRDIRVLPERRGAGIGKILFTRACEWSAFRGCRQMKIETQNINLAACHFYRKMDCELGTIKRYAYWQNPTIAHEIMLNWHIDL